MAGARPRVRSAKSIDGNAPSPGQSRKRLECVAFSAAFRPQRKHPNHQSKSARTITIPPINPRPALHPKQSATVILNCAPASLPRLLSPPECFSLQAEFKTVYTSTFHRRDPPSTSAAPATAHKSPSSSPCQNDDPPARTTSTARKKFPEAAVTSARRDKASSAGNLHLRSRASNAWPSAMTTHLHLAMQPLQNLFMTLARRRNA